MAVGALGLADDLNWPAAATKRCLAEIERAGMAVVDHVAKLIWLPNSIPRYNMPANPSSVAGWRLYWRMLPACALRERAAEAIRATLAAEDERRSRAGKPSGLATAFSAVLGETCFASAGPHAGHSSTPAEVSEHHGAPPDEEHGGGTPWGDTVGGHHGGSPSGDTEGDTEGGHRGAAPSGDTVGEHPSRAGVRDARDQGSENREQNPTPPAGARAEGPPQPPRIVDIQIPAPLADYAAIAQRLADEGVGFAAKMLDQLAQGRTLTAAQRSKLREIDADLRAADRVGTGAAATASNDVPELEAYVVRRWAEARKRRELGANDPDPRVAAQVAGIAARASEAAEPDARGWKPSATETVAAWISRYLREEGRGTAEDREWPFTWLPGRCRDYPLPKRSEVQRGVAPQDVAPPRTVPADASNDPPDAETTRAGLDAVLARIGDGGANGPQLRATRPGAPALRVVTGGEV